jgi:hypothetical protein
MPELDKYEWRIRMIVINEAKRIRAHCEQFSDIPLRKNISNHIVSVANMVLYPFVSSQNATD